MAPTAPNSHCASGSASTAPTGRSGPLATTQPRAAAGAAAISQSQPRCISNRLQTPRATTRGWGMRTASTEYHSRTIPGKRSS